MHDSQLATTKNKGKNLGGQHKVSLQHIFLGHENIVEVMVPTPKPRPESCTGLGKTQKGALGKSDKAVGVELVESEKKQKIGSHCNDNVLETKSNSLSRSEQLQKRGNKQGPSVGRAVAAKVVNAPSTPKKNAPPLPTLQDSASGKSDDESLVDGNASANTKTDAATKRRQMLQQTQRSAMEKPRGRFYGPEFSHEQSPTRAIVVVSVIFHNAIASRRIIS